MQKPLLCPRQGPAVLEQLAGKKYPYRQLCASFRSSGYTFHVCIVALVSRAKRLRVCVRLKLYRVTAEPPRGFSRSVRRAGADFLVLIMAFRVEGRVADCE